MFSGGITYAPTGGGPTLGLPASVLATIPRPYPHEDTRQVRMLLTSDALYCGTGQVDLFTPEIHSRVVDFVGKYRPRYPAFVKNVFLGRFAFQRQFEDTRYSPSNHRQQTKEAIDRWVEGLTYFLDGPEAILSEKPKQLGAVRRRIDDMSLDVLFNSRRGKLSFSMSYAPSRQIAANRKLVYFLMDEFALKPTADEITALRRLVSRLQLTKATKKNARIFLRRFSNAKMKKKRIGQVPEVDPDVAWDTLNEDPFYWLMYGQVQRVVDRSISDPVRAVRILATMKRFIELNEIGRFDRHLIRLGVDPIETKTVIEATSIGRSYIEEQLKDLHDDHTGKPFFIDKLERMVARLPIRLRIALVEYAKAGLKSYDGDRMEWRRLTEYGIQTTYELFKRAADLTRGYLSCIDITRDHGYIIEQRIYERIIAIREDPNIGRLNIRRRLPHEILHWFLDELFDEEKPALNVAAAYAVLLGISPEEWEKIETDLIPPNLNSAKQSARAFGTEQARKVIAEEIWSVISAKGSYLVKAEGIRRLERKRLKIQRVTLHEMMANGHDVTPHLDYVKRRILEASGGVEGFMDLPAKVLDRFATTKALDIVRNNISSLNGMPKRARFIVEAVMMLDNILDSEGIEEKRRIIRTGVLNLTFDQSIHYVRLEEDLRAALRDVLRTI